MKLVWFLALGMTFVMGSYSGDSYSGNYVHGKSQGSGTGFQSSSASGDGFAFGGSSTGANGIPNEFGNFFSDYLGIFKQQQDAIFSGLQRIQQQTLAAAKGGGTYKAFDGRDSSGGFGSSFDGASGDRSSKPGFSGGFGGGYGGSFGNRGGFADSFGNGYSGGSGFGSSFSGTGASASGFVNPNGGFQSANVYPENSEHPNVNTRFGGNGNNAPGGFYSVFTSSKSGTSNINGKPTTFHEAATTVNDNGKVTTYKVRNP